MEMARFQVVILECHTYGGGRCGNAAAVIG